MAKKLDILNQLQQAVANPAPVEQQTPVADVADVKANEVVQQPVQAKQLSPAEQFQQELAASGMGASEYLYAKSHPTPQAPDEKALRRQRTLANITDLGLLLTDGIGAVAGGNVNKRTETATGNANTQAERLQQVYEKQKAAYGDQIYNARAKDSEYAKEIELRKANRLQKEADLKEERLYTEGRDKAKAEEQRVLYGVKTKADEEKDAKNKEFTAAEKEKDRKSREGIAAKSANKTTTTKPKAVKPVSRLAIQKMVEQYQDDADAGRRLLAAYFLDNGADTPLEAAKEALKYFPKKK